MAKVIERTSHRDLVGGANADGQHVHAGGGGSSYMYPVWAEENSGLGNNTYEWAYGNGANTPNDGGMTIYVPTGKVCEVVAMSLRIGSGTATVELLINGALQGSSANVAISSGQSGTNEFTPIALVNNDFINFRTTSSSGTTSPNVVTAWLRVT